MAKTIEKKVLRLGDALTAVSHALYACGDTKLILTTLDAKQGRFIVRASDVRKTYDGDGDEAGNGDVAVVVAETSNGNFADSTLMTPTQAIKVRAGLYGMCAVRAPVRKDGTFDVQKVADAVVTLHGERVRKDMSTKAWQDNAIKAHDELAGYVPPDGFKLSRSLNGEYTVSVAFSKGGLAVTEAQKLIAQLVALQKETE